MLNINLLTLNLIMIKETNSKNTQVAATCLLYTVANADNNIDEKELSIIKDILIDFFSTDEIYTKKLMDESYNIWHNSTDLFQFGNILNNELTHQDKLDFILCIYEVAYIDGKCDYFEQEAIKKIANILNLHRDELISAKSEIEFYLK